MTASDFIDGQKDCRNGVPHQDGKSEDYDRGYAFEYFLQEQREWLKEWRNKKGVSELGVLI